LILGKKKYKFERIEKRKEKNKYNFEKNIFLKKKKKKKREKKKSDPSLEGWLSGKGLFPFSLGEGRDMVSCLQ
jgi:hypothetical protein